MKRIIYYIFEFLLAILFFITILLFILKTTVLSPNYIINKMEKNAYYEQVYDSLKEEMSNYMIQSSLPKEILENIYTKDTVKEELNRYIKSFYQGTIEEIETKDLEEKLLKNIDTYFNENNIRITEQESINKFISLIADAYKTEIIQSDSILKFKDFISKITLLVNIIIVINIVMMIIVTFIIKCLLKSKIKCIPLLTTAFLLLISYLFIKQNIDIKNIMILTNHFSILIRSIINEIVENMKKIAIILIVISILSIIISNLKEHKKEIKIITIE